MKYRITNITKKPGHRKGKFKRGFFVDVKPNDKVKPMGVGQHVDVDEVTPGILAMQSKEYISVEPIKDLDVQIANKIEANEAKTLANLKSANAQLIAEKQDALELAKEAAEELEALKKAGPVPVSGLDKDAMKAAASPSNTLKATVSGGETEGDDPLADVEDSVNPDGEPNFVVKTKVKGSKKGKK